jgi:hypothetical protein
MSAKLTGPNPLNAGRSTVVTNLAAEAWAPRELDEQLYCARGEMENRIKECQLDQPRRRRGSIPARADVGRHRRGADRTSTGTMRANQLRLVDPLRGSTAAMADVLLAALRRIGLQATRLAPATAGTIRLKLLKVRAPVRISVRRVTVARGSSAALPSGGSGLWPDGLRPPLAARPGARPPRPHRSGALTARTAHSRHSSSDRCRPAAPYVAAQCPARPPPVTSKSANHARKLRCPRQNWPR